MEFPAEFCRRMERLLMGSYPDFLNAYNRSAGRGLRVNTLKCPTEDFQRLFPLPLVPSPFSSMGFVVDQPLKAGADPLHHAGAYYMQEPSAMSAVTVLDPRPGERILDLCAAPGGKTTQIASLLGGNGLIWANEYVRSRAQILLQNLERCGVRNSVVSNAEPALLAAGLPGWFDGVLVDAPCSGLGVIRKKPDIRYKDPEPVRDLPQVQRAILDNAARYVKPGGVLVYSTCTLLRRENEEVALGFLADHPQFKAEGFPLPEYVGDARTGMLTLWPHRQGTDGFFICKLRKEE